MTGEATKRAAGAARTSLRPGRPTNSVTADTRERILDAAEALLADEGYDGTSIRNVANRAGVALAVVTYHLGSKEQLFDAVIERRASLMERMRTAELRRALDLSGNAPVEIDVLARGYVVPFLQFARTHDTGWQNYAILMGRLSNSPRGRSVIDRYYDPTARRYLAEFRRALPGISATEVALGFMGIVSLMLFVCAGTGRLEALITDGDEDFSDDALIDCLVAYCTAGMRGIAAAKDPVEAP